MEILKIEITGKKSASANVLFNRVAVNISDLNYEFNARLCVSIEYQAPS